MDKRELLARRGYFHMVHGVTVRAIEALSDSDLGFRPHAVMRTPRELIFHIYAQERLLAEAGQRGQFTMEMANGSNPEDPANAATVAALATVSDVVAFANAQHQAAEAIYQALSDDEVARKIESPFGTYPAWQFFLFAYDEHWHHRGQIYTYLRLLGKEPPMLYDYQMAES
jgi:uncharacterized damage-inducible protein DinB